jgi:hypothetical protein
MQVLVQSQLDEQLVESEMLKASFQHELMPPLLYADVLQAVENFIAHFDTISDESVQQFLVSFAAKEMQPDISVRKAADRLAFHVFANHRHSATAYSVTRHRTLFHAC